MSELDKLTSDTVQLAGLPINKPTPVGTQVNMLIYGDAGVGKTVLAGSASEVPSMSPVLLIDMEGGTMSLTNTYPNVDVVRLTTYQDLQNVFMELYEGNTEYQTVVIDSLTEIQKFSMYTIMGKVVDDDPERDPDIPSLREWGKNLEQIRRTVRAFRDLPINTIFTALAFSDSKPNSSNVKVRPGLTGKLSAEVAAFVDVVAYYYIKTILEDGERIHKRLLLTAQAEGFVAKDRTGKLPAIIEDPTMDQIMQLATAE